MVIRCMTLAFNNWWWTILWSMHRRIHEQETSINHAFGFNSACDWFDTCENRIHILPCLRTDQLLHRTQVTGISAAAYLFASYCSWFACTLTECDVLSLDCLYLWYLLAATGRNLHTSHPHNIYFAPSQTNTLLRNAQAVINIQIKQWRIKILFLQK